MSAVIFATIVLTILVVLVSCSIGYMVGRDHERAKGADRHVDKLTDSLVQLSTSQQRPAASSPVPAPVPVSSLPVQERPKHSGIFLGDDDSGTQEPFDDSLIRITKNGQGVAASIPMTP